MTKIQYANGMYKTTTKAQDATAQAIFRAFRHQTHPIMVTMGCQFDQNSGNAGYLYYNEQDVCILSIIINRNGKIL